MLILKIISKIEFFYNQLIKLLIPTCTKVLQTIVLATKIFIMMALSEDFTTKKKMKNSKYNTKIKKGCSSIHRKYS